MVLSSSVVLSLWGNDPKIGPLRFIFTCVCVWVCNVSGYVCVWVYVYVCVTLYHFLHRLTNIINSFIFYQILNFKELEYLIFSFTLIMAQCSCPKHFSYLSLPMRNLAVSTLPEPHNLVSKMKIHGSWGKFNFRKLWVCFEHHNHCPCLF